VEDWKDGINSMSRPSTLVYVPIPLEEMKSMPMSLAKRSELVTTRQRCFKSCRHSSFLTFSTCTESVSEILFVPYPDDVLVLEKERKKERIYFNVGRY